MQTLKVILCCIVNEASLGDMGPQFKTNKQREEGWEGRKERDGGKEGGREMKRDMKGRGGEGE